MTPVKGRVGTIPARRAAPRDLPELAGTCMTTCVPRPAVSNARKKRVRSGLLIRFINGTTHISSWVVWELETAIETAKPIVAMEVKGGKMMNRPLCFDLMPFGKKPDGTGGTVDFDAVYGEVIAPAIEAAGMQPLRADEEMGGGMIHKPMFERLILCEYTVADLTTANANVFYELGIRHAARPWSTVLIYVDKARLPFDAAPLRAIPYRLAAGGTPAEAENVRAVIADRLDRARDAVPDSPIYELVEDFPDVDHSKTDVFRDRVQYSTSVKARLAEARDARSVDAVREIERELEPIEDQEAGIVVDLLLSYRALKGWKEMVALTARMSPPLAETVMVQEQLAFTLNRDGQGERAERVLLELLEKRGPSSETYGILGRVYKDRWDEALAGRRAALARGLLRKAIDAYLKGFEADWRDAYPGVNAVTLIEIADPPDPRRERLIPVVS
jgi:hypothetical protein